MFLYRTFCHQLPWFQRGLLLIIVKLLKTSGTQGNHQQIEAAISNIFDDHDIVEKAMQLYVNIHHDDSMTIKMRKDCRSRYAKFVYYNHNRVVCYCHGGRRQKITLVREGRV